MRLTNQGEYLKFDIVKIANAIIYLLDKKVAHLNDKKLSIMLFLMDYNHQENCGEKIFNEEYVKTNRNPKPRILGEVFDIIANNEDLDEDDERLFVIQELLDYIDIEIIDKEKFVELQFIKMEEGFDEELFNVDEFKTMNKIIKLYGDMTPRNIANECFKIDTVRETANDEVII